MGSVFRTIAAVAAATASLAAHAIASNWKIVDLGTIGGPGLSSPQAVADNGVVVGCAAVAGDNGIRAFIYANGVMSDLSPGLPAGSMACATAVNSAGLVGGRIDGEIVVWNNGTLTRLGVKGGISAINEAGVAVGTIVENSSTQPPPTHGFMWVAGNMYALPMDTAVDVDEHNNVLGMVGGSAAIFSSGTLTKLPLNNANAFNDAGIVVGGMSFTPGEPSGFYYDGTAHVVPGSPCCGFATHINNANQIVGSSEGVHGWLSEGGQTSLLDNLSGVAGSGWGHLEPTSMNSRAWIVGTGNGPNGFGGFLLTPSVSSTPASTANPEARETPRNHALIRARTP